MYSYFLDVSYEYPEYVHLVPRDTIPLVVVVVAAYVPVLSGNVGEVDIVNCSCQSLVSLDILSMHMSIVLYYLQGMHTTAYIEFTCYAQSRASMTINMCTYLQYVHVYSANVCVDICLKRILIYVQISL